MEDKRRQPRTQEHKEKISNSLKEARLGLKKLPDEKNRLRALKADLKSRYGLDYETYLELLESHNNVCGICKKPETAISSYGTPRRLTVDHCHETGRVRGLLCDNCNRGLGHLQDDVSILKSAIEYLGQ